MTLVQLFNARCADLLIDYFTGALAVRGYVTGLAAHYRDGMPVTPEFVDRAYRRLFQIERSVRVATPIGPANRGASSRPAMSPTRIT